MKTLSALDARVKLLCLLVYFVAAFHARSALALAMCLVLSLACAFAVRLKAREYVGVLRPLAPVLLVTVFMQVLYFQQGQALFSVGPISITAIALQESARMIACLLCVMAMSVVFMRCTAVEEMTRALGWLLAPLRKAGLRTDAFMFSLSVAFRFVDTLVKEFRQLRRAQMARLQNFDGSVRERLQSYARLFAPLTRSALRRADMLAEASVGRCFGCGIAPTQLHARPPGIADAMAVCVVVAIAAAAFAL